MRESHSGDGEFYSRAEEDSQAARGRGKRSTGKLQRKTQGKSSNESVDPILPEKKRARRRLVGAVALVLAVIIGLPMILDSEPKPLADDIAIQIPSKDKDRLTTAAPPQASREAIAAQSEQIIQAPGASAGTSAASAKMPVPTASTTTAVPAAGPAAPGKIKGEAKPVEPVRIAEHEPPAKQHASQIAAEKIETKPAAENHAVDKKSDVRAEAILDGKADADAGKSNTDKKPSKLIVQIAAFASQDKVDELQGKLNEAGIKSYTQKVPTTSGDRIRVRVGPFASKGEADDARAKLSKLGLNSTLVSPPPHDDF